MKWYTIFSLTVWVAENELYRDTWSWQSRHGGSNTNGTILPSSTLPIGGSLKISLSILFPLAKIPFWWRKHCPETRYTSKSVIPDHSFCIPFSRSLMMWCSISQSNFLFHPYWYVAKDWCWYSWNFWSVYKQWHRVKVNRRWIYIVGLGKTSSFFTSLYPQTPSHCNISLQFLHKEPLEWILDHQQCSF